MSALAVVSWAAAAGIVLASCGGGGGDGSERATADETSTTRSSDATENEPKGSTTSTTTIEDLEAAAKGDPEICDAIPVARIAELTGYEFQNANPSKLLGGSTTPVEGPACSYEGATAQSMAPLYIVETPAEEATEEGLTAALENVKSNAEADLQNPTGKAFNSSNVDVGDRAVIFDSRPRDAGFSAGVRQHGGAVLVGDRAFSVLTLQTVTDAQMTAVLQEVVDAFG